jgi:D-alanine transfer protein
VAWHLLLKNNAAFVTMTAVPSGSSPNRPHLRAALLALVLSTCAVAAGVAYCERLEGQFIHALAPEFSDEKLQGVALQAEAFRQPDLLVMYGSSELAKEMPNNAVQFFQDYPTGFRVFPVGKPGATSLAILQKIAAVGKEVRGRKLAYSISPGWFFSEVFDPKYYMGNFSDLQALHLAFSSELSHELKRDIARRMLDYPDTTDDSWVLDFALHRLAGDSADDRLLYAAIWPLGKLESAVGRTQDHFEAAVHILDEDEKLNPQTRRGLRVLNWNDILKRAAQFANATAVQAKKNEVVKRKAAKKDRSKGFQQALAHAQEWTDFELLLRTFHELGAQPLLLSMPLEDIRLEVYGLDNAARLSYVNRLDSLADRFEYPLLMFRDHETDPAFLYDFQDHLSAEGWLYYNKALDDFFHNRLTSL